MGLAAVGSCNAIGPAAQPSLLRAPSNASTSGAGSRAAREKTCDRARGLSPASGAPRTSPARWDTALSPSGKNLAVYLADRISTLSLTNGVAFATIPVPPQSDYEHYEGLTWLDDDRVGFRPPFMSRGTQFWSLSNPSWTQSRIEATSPDGQWQALLPASGTLTVQSLSAPDSHHRLFTPPDQEWGDKAELTWVVWSRDSRTLLGIGNWLQLKPEGRVTAWDVETGKDVSMHSFQSPITRVIPTQHGWVVQDEWLVERFERGSEVFKTSLPFDYSPTTDVMASVEEEILQLTDATGTVTGIRLPASERAVRLAFDHAGTQLAVGTTHGIRVLDLATRTYSSDIELGRPAALLGWSGDRVILGDAPELAPDPAWTFVDVGTGSRLIVGLTLAKNDLVQWYAASSSGWVDADPATLAALRGGAQHEAAIPAACVHTGLLRDWLSGALE